MFIICQLKVVFQHLNGRGNNKREAKSLHSFSFSSWALFFQLKTIKLSKWKRNEWEWMQNGRKSHDSHFIKNVIMLCVRARVARVQNTVYQFSSRHHISVAWRVHCVCELRGKISVNKTCEKCSNRFTAVSFALPPVSTIAPVVVLSSFYPFLVSYSIRLLSFLCVVLQLHLPFLFHYLLNEIVLPLNINGMYLPGSNFKCYAIPCERVTVNRWNVCFYENDWKVVLAFHQG